MHRLPGHLARNMATSWVGPAGHVLHYPVHRGELMNFIGFVERTDWTVESWTVAGTVGELADDFRGWHDDVHAICGPPAYVPDHDGKGKDLSHVCVNA